MKLSDDRNFFSVVIVNYNRSADLFETLKSLRGQTVPDFEIIVVDNCSTDDSVPMIVQNYPDVILKRLNKNQGVSGFNIGVKVARGNYCILLDNDVIVPVTFMEDLYRMIQSYPSISVFALNVVTPNGVRQRDYLPQDQQEPVLWHNFIGGGAVVSTEDYRNIGGYNPQYFIYINETEFSARVLLSGKKILYCPQIKVIHKTSPVSRNVYQNYYYFVRNSVFFMKTYFKLYKKIDLILGFMLINLLKSIKEKSMKIYCKALVDACKMVSIYVPSNKLEGEVAQKLSSSWQGNPSLSNILVRKLWKRYR